MPREVKKPPRIAKQRLTQLISVDLRARILSGTYPIDCLLTGNGEATRALMRDLCDTSDALPLQGVAAAR